MYDSNTLFLKPVLIFSLILMIEIINDQSNDWNNF